MENSGGVRSRVYLIGALLSVCVIFMAHYSISIVHGSTLAIDHMPAGGVFVFFVLVLLLNPVLRLIRKTYELNPGELLIVYIMLLVTSSITTMGLGASLLSIIAAPFYFATPENRWAELVHPHLRNWMHPSGERAIQHFFEGLPPGEGIPWAAWLQPVMAWFVLIFALYMVMLFLMVILRRQWVEKEKLTYPLVQLPLEMVHDDGKGAIKPLFRNKLFWAAVAIPLVISSINALHSYFHFIPYITLHRSVPVFQRTMGMMFRLSFPIMGFTYLVNQEVALGVWFFNLLFLVVRGIFNMTGISSAEQIGIYGAVEPIFKNVGTGAFLSFVFMGFWMAKSHLKEVFGRAFGKNKSDDSDEIVSYRTAVFGLIFGLAVMLVWLMMSGMSFTIALLFMVFAMVFFVGLTRIIAEAGIATMISPSIGSGQVVSSLGSSAIGHEGMTALGMTYVYSSDIRTFPMSAIAQGLKMGDWIKGRRRGGMFFAIVLAIFIAYFVSNWLVLRLAYNYGGINLNTWFFVNGPQRPFQWPVSHMLHPVGPSPSGWAARGAGAALMAGLMFIRYRFLWWPFHPLGFAIGSVTYMDQLWFTIFIVWLVKAMILKYGGVRLFRQGRPFFLGLILGQYSAAVIWFLIDLMTGHTGNRVFWI